MTYLTQQEIFDKVAVHLLTQNARSKEAVTAGVESQCLYRDKAGLRCAVGCLMPADVDTSRFNNLSLSGIPNEVREAMRVDFRLDRPLLESLQRCHDVWPIPTWRDGLRRLAGELSLSANVLNPVPKETA